MRYLICDIETISHPDADGWLEPVEPDPKLLEPIEPDSRLKDPVKVAANLEDVERRRAQRPAEIEASVLERTAERNEKLGLDPDCCRIVALGYHVVGGSDPICALCLTEDEERFALERFWAAYTAVPETILVTFYGHSFDVPVLLRRSMYLGVRTPRISLDKYRSPHIDIWNELTYRGALRTARSLAFYGKRFGIGTLDKVDGADVAKLWAAGEYEAVREHCLSDVGLTHAIANKLGLLRVIDLGRSQSQSGAA